MTLESTPEVSVSDQEYSHVWAEATTRTLEQLQGSPLIPAPEGPAPPDKAAPSPEESLTVLFKVSGLLNGEQSFQFLKTDGVRLAQLLMAEPLDPAVAFAEGHADALNEIFRQFAGLAATACKAKYGGEVLFELIPGKTAEWKPVNNSVWTFSSEKIPALQWTTLFSPELHASIEAAHHAPSSPAEAAPPPPEPPTAEASPPAATSDAPAPSASPESAEAAPPAPGTTPVAPEAPTPPAPAAAAPPQQAAPSTMPPPVAATPPPQPVAVAPPPPPKVFVPPPTPPRLASVPSPPPPAGPAGNPANLDLLLDVVLEATLRFGQREMVLREILELRPGAVVELNRRIQEPAELLVAGRVIARGEVVIVDGAYGLRITDITQPHQRLESVET